MDSPILGILLFETAADRIVGDPGHPETFPFPMLFATVQGSYRDLIEPGHPTALSALVKAARELESQGATVIAGDCGLMALHQREMSKEVRVPLISSALVLLPLLSTFIGGAPVGVITGHSKLLKDHHLQAVSAKELPLCIHGMENESHFAEVVIAGTATQIPDQMELDLHHAATELLERSPEVGALLLECSNLAPFSADLQRSLGLPVFDINSGIRLLMGVQAGR